MNGSSLHEVFHPQRPGAIDMRCTLVIILNPMWYRIDFYHKTLLVSSHGCHQLKGIICGISANSGNIQTKHLRTVASNVLLHFEESIIGSLKQLRESVCSYRLRVQRFH